MIGKHHRRVLSCLVTAVVALTAFGPPAAAGEPVREELAEQLVGLADAVGDCLKLREGDGILVIIQPGVPGTPSFPLHPEPVGNEHVMAMCMSNLFAPLQWRASPDVHLLIRVERVGGGRTVITELLPFRSQRSASLYIQRELFGAEPAADTPAVVHPRRAPGLSTAVAGAVPAGDRKRMLRAEPRVQICRALWERDTQGAKPPDLVLERGPDKGRLRIVAPFFTAAGERYRACVLTAVEPEYRRKGPKKILVLGWSEPLDD